MATTEDVLLKRYGVLLSLKDCSELLGRSPEGLRVTLHSDGELSRKLQAAKVKLGRRILFKATELARMLDEA